MYSPTIQRFIAWGGAFALAIFFIGLLLAGFFPPIPPNLPQEEVVRLYQENNTGILLGMTLMMISGMFISPFVALISEQLKRIEGSTPLLPYAQLSAGSMGIMFFILPAIFFLITAYRPDRPPEITYLMNDISWIFTVLPWPMAFMQNICIGLAVISDKSANPIFPRWLGFFNFWLALMLVPASILIFVKSGPFAWNGLFAFWIPANVFGIWFGVMLWLLLKAIKRQEQEARAKA